MQLTQTENMLLQQQKMAEEVCIQKYQNYAQQAQSQQLKNIFNQYAQQEQNHLSTIQQLLQGQQPNLAGGQQGQQQQQQQTQQSSTAGFQSQSDYLLVNDALMTEKYVSNEYDSAIFQAANPVVREALKHIQKEEQQHGEGLYNYMIGQGTMSQP